MKILHVHNQNKIIGGSEVYIRDIMKQLRAHNVNCTLFVLSGDKEISFYTDYLFIGKYTRAEISEVLSKEIEKNNFDLIHIHNLPSQFLTKILLNNAPVIRHMHGPLLVCPGWDKFLRRSQKICTRKFGLHCLYHAYTENCCLSRIPLNVIKAYENTRFEVNVASNWYEFIITNSEFLRNEAIKADIDPTKIQVIPYFTDYKEFSYKYLEKKKILFIGRLEQYKGIILLLDSMKNIFRLRQDVTLDIVGDGQLMGNIKSIIIKNNWENKVTLHGWKTSEEISEILSGSYFVVFPSIYPEAFGIVGIEAAMHSKPVIAFNVGGVGTWLSDGYNGCLIDKISNESLSNKIMELLENESLHKQMCENAWANAQEKFQNKNHLSKLLNLYRQITSK